MSYFTWSSKFETGIEIVDFQHRKLISLVNELEEATREKDPSARDTIVRVTLEQLIDYTGYHFKVEEDLMKQAHYEHMAEHKAAHDALKTAALDINKKLEQGEDVLPRLLVFLKSWLEKHILVTDMQYVSAMQKSNLGSV